MEQSELDALLTELKKGGEAEQSSASVAGTVLSPTCLLIKIEGRAVGPKEAAVVFGQIRDLVEATDHHLIVDLQECRYLSSFVLGEFSRVIADKREQGRKVCVIGANAMMRGLFEMTSLSQFLVVCDSQEEALQQIESASGAS